MRVTRWVVVVGIFTVASVLVGLGLSFLGGQADKIDRLSSGYSTLYSQVQSLGATPEAPAPHDALKGDQGEPGRDGRDGAPGRNGIDSTVPGPAGQPGAPGSAGAAGGPGPPGAQGEPGPAGADGQPGADGAPGQSAFPFYFSFVQADGSTVTCNLLSSTAVGSCTTADPTTTTTTGG